MGKKVKKKFSFKKFIIFLIIIVILYLIVDYALNIKTKNIVILNNNYYTDDEIIYTSNIENYPKFILLSKSKIKRKLKKLDLIEDVDIKKKKGFVLEINIQEKKVLYFVRSNEEYILSDGSHLKNDDTFIVPTLINFVPEEIEKSFIKSFSKIDKNIIEKVSEIEYSKTKYDEKRFLLYMSDGNEVYINISKMDLLNKYVSIVSKLENKKGILYLDSGNYFEIKEK